MGRLLKKEFMKFQRQIMRGVFTLVFSCLLAACGNRASVPTAIRADETTAVGSAPTAIGAVEPTAASAQTPRPPTPAFDTPAPTLDSNSLTPPSIIKSIGFEMGEIDLASGRAGDILLVGVAPVFGKIIYDYGEVITNTSSGEPKVNLQPTFYLPLGTKVRSLIDGVVVDIPILWSGDYSVMVVPEGGEGLRWRWETEHVINPIVKVGDHVTAGQVLAEVSDYESGNNPNLGIVEIGLLEGGNPPRHLCPFLYLDPSVKAQIESWLVDLRAAWEQAQGDLNIYDESAYATPGCKITDPIEG